MAQWILKANGCVVPRRTAIPLTTAQQKSETDNNKRALFNKLITKRWGTYISPPSVKIDKTTENILDPYEYPDEPANEMPEFFELVDIDTAQLIDQQPAYHRLIHSEVALP